MRWFKHLTDSADDEKLARVLSELGPEGYGVWWLIVGAVAKQIGPKDTKTFASYSVSHWIRITHIYHHKKFKKIIGILESLHLILVEVEGTCPKDSAGDVAEIHKRLSKKTENLCNISATSPKDVLIISIPNILKYRDEYSKKSGQTPESVRSKKEKEKEIQIQIQNKTLTAGKIAAPAATKTELAFQSVFQEKETRIRELYPNHNFEAEMETCIAHYRNDASAAMDPYKMILKWFNRSQISPIFPRKEHDNLAFLKEVDA